MNQQSTKTDNKSVHDKIYLRKQAIMNLEAVHVLDLFAGRNVLWNNISKDSYYGVDIANGKGKNLVANSHEIFDSLDLSAYNVIDVDSYGISFDIYKKIFSRQDVQPGTVVIYTAITNEFTQIRTEAMDEFRFRSFYKKAPTLFNARAVEFFYEMLANHGIKEVNYYEIRDHYLKHYGYFKIN